MPLSDLLNLLGFGGFSENAPEPPDAIAAIVAELERLPDDRARTVAAFAVVLSRVAHADLAISQDEIAAIEEILKERAHLSDDEARVVVRIAHRQSHEAGGTENFLATREYVERSTPEERVELLDCLFAVSAADGSISSAEENQIRQIASELRLSPKRLREVRSRWNEYRAVLK